MTKTSIYSLIHCILTGAVVTLSANAVRAQVPSLGEMRELRVSCLESFNAAQSRLDDLREFVSQQANRQRGVAERLSKLEKDAAEDKVRLVNLEQSRADNKTRLDRTATAVERATSSYRTAGKVLPNGEAWVTDGSAALAEMRRLVMASPDNEWRRERTREAEQKFGEAMGGWRAARREFDQAGFDLELRTSPNSFKRLGDQNKAMAGELTTITSQLAIHSKTLSSHRKESDRWAEALQKLNTREQGARTRLADNLVKFHLVDLKFAAWRLGQPADKNDAYAALPDLREQLIMDRPLAGSAREGLEPLLKKYLDNGAPRFPRDGRLSSIQPLMRNDGNEAAFLELLARISLAEARLKFLADLWQQETGEVRKVVQQVNDCENETAKITDDVARVAMDVESLRRFVDGQQQSLAAGLESLELIEKRFASDFDAINRILDDTASRTATLEKRLEK
ncbi:MAG: hypothetical protein WCO56_25900 [Verrucomicrobiota bacterium]